MPSHKPMPMGGCGPRHWGPPIRECRREAKELLVEPEARANPPAKQVDVKTQDKVVSDTPTKNIGAEVIGFDQSDGSLVIDGETATGSRKAIIGGGCCVQLSVEYMPAKPVLNADSSSPKCAVTVEVVDNEDCYLGWRKVFQEGYHVKESIITTYPGARLAVAVNNAIARVRWCEIFSC
jgi:hypothetical protein